MHICVGKLTIIGSDNGLLPGRRQAIVWTSAGMLLIGPKEQTWNALENVICEMASTLSQTQCVNSCPPKAAYMRQCIGSALVQVMAWRWTGNKPLPEPKLPYCQLNSWEQISVKFKSKSFSFKKMLLKLLSAKMVTILSRVRWVNC